MLVLHNRVSGDGKRTCCLVEDVPARCRGFGLDDL